MIFWWVAAAATTLLVCLSTRKSRRLSSLLVRFLFAYPLQRFESDIWGGTLHLPGPLPRNADELIAFPLRLQGMLNAHHTGVLLKSNNNGEEEEERIIKIAKLNPITTEPDKQQTAGSILVSIQSNTKSVLREVSLFCKYQTGRGMPRWMQALRWADEGAVAREVDFYNCIWPLGLPIRTPRPVLCCKAPVFNYVFLALEHIKLGSSGDQHRVVNDYQSASPRQVEAMVSRVAKMHSALRLRLEEPALRWIPARHGLDYAKWLESFAGSEAQRGAFSSEVWSSLKAYFAARPVTLVHGDCRPGNMIFKMGKRGSEEEEVEDVVFADWEAVNVAPFLWDVAYCTTLGWTASSRRLHQPAALQAYLDALNQQEGQEGQEGGEEGDVLARRDDLPLLVLVLAYVSRTIRVNGFWSNQGNTSLDQRAWLVRVALAVGDLDAKRVAALLGLLDDTAITALQRQSRAETEAVVAAFIPKDKDWAEI